MIKANLQSTLHQKMTFKQFKTIYRTFTVTGCETGSLLEYIAYCVTAHLKGCYAKIDDNEIPTIADRSPRTPKISFHNLLTININKYKEAMDSGWPKAKITNKTN